jgi:hypothetical protein
MPLKHVDIEQIVQLLDQAVGAMEQVKSCCRAAQLIVEQDAPAFQLFTTAQYAAFDSAQDRMIAKRDVLRAKTLDISDI